MHIIPCPIQGVFLLEITSIEDHRGSFARLYCQAELQSAGVHKPITQINTSLTLAKGAIRGMHFQHPPHAECKIVRCLQGSCFDVAVDIRKNSPTFLQWHGEMLSAENGKALVVPEGFAHGFQTLEENTRLLYLHTAMYAPEAEGGLLYNDQTLSINWPLPPQGISDRDRRFPHIDAHFLGIQI
ncbi:dTDP-4-dehydrorhamnose 3,5-epimerase [Maridesulfovibrio ferrireducens]|uniref:dTDP-4-dehydrorhamnose 3,5-epimerase n=1 Tax=Maridesulfovibrio ferrireducens TaxID=246191 RepID=UPI001A35BE3F|nr:dTDP-4-dehydrorhamnose 3,5-epimerase [Maridesulfovibrio ferrireducens]MBI9113159.1 dTDP-4-dehydrorhamnose 3,5-epimerase [Maridesulfovibrio ferrireducens]